MSKQKELENLISSFQKWCLRKNMIAAKNEKMPIIFSRCSAHCSFVEFELRESTSNYDKEIKIKSHYGKYLTIYYNKKYISNTEYISSVKSSIKDFVSQYIRTKNEITTYKFNQIDKACIDLIDNENIFLNKEKNIKVKSIISKTEVIDYDNITYEIKDLFVRYL